MKEKVTLSINIEPLDKINPLISKYSCNIMAVDVEAKSFIFSKEILQNLIPVLKGAPILTYYSYKDDQFAGHEGDFYRSNKTGIIKQTPELTGVGFVDYVSEPEFKIINSKEWLTCICYLWDGRFSFLQGLSDRKDIWQSVEIAVDYEEKPDGTKIVTDAILLGLALIGVQPAFEGSTFFESFSKDNIDNEINLLKKEYEQIINQQEQKNNFSEENVINNEVYIKKNNSSESFNINNFNKEGDEVIKEAVEKFSLNSDQIREILRNGLSEFKYNQGDYEWNKYYVDCYDAEYVYVYDNEDDKTYRMTYDIAEMVATINMESKEEVIRGNYIPVSQSTQENEQMSEEEVKNEEMSTEEMASKNEEEMSSNEFVDNTAMQQLNDNAAETNKELSNEQVNNAETETNEKDVLIASLKDEMSTMKEKISKLESDLNSFSEENNKLKEFKENIEKQNKKFAVETTLKEVEGVLPKEEIDTFRISSEKFSLENIDAWKNEVQAKAFNFSKNIEKKPFIQVGLPVSDKPKRGTGLWD